MYNSSASLFKLRPYARFAARILGYELVGEGNSWSHAKEYKLFKRRLPSGFSNSKSDPYFTPFSVPITSITSRVCFSYSEDGWHPFVQTLREYEENPVLRYEESTLARVYGKYTPQNVQEVLLDQVRTPLPPFCSWPPSYELVSWVWTLNKYSVQHRLKQLQQNTKHNGWILFGPHAVEYGRKEFNRLIAVYESIKRTGYIPKVSSTDPINGYILKDEDRIRFVLLQGNHRVSALKVLGYSNVDVLIRPGHPAVIDKSNLQRWTEGSGGIYTSTLTEHLFDTLFTELGLQKARRLDLM
ncbi:hypothetical protein [Pontibacter ruber]|uniref:ParB-like nuclease family protein n=1 Tax=Pontibacter ruber TaxID=1343895 RepID=A0ABW5CTJ7_9BACT|nr:hypothetical protein [Pontibacter ruber]